MGKEQPGCRSLLPEASQTHSKPGILSPFLLAMAGLHPLRVLRRQDKLPKAGEEDTGARQEGDCMARMLMACEYCHHLWGGNDKHWVDIPLMIGLSHAGKEEPIP